MKCYGSDVIVFWLNVTVNSTKEEKKRKRSNCVCLKISGNYLHCGELRKCGQKEKHDQSGRSAVTIVSHTRAEVCKQERW